MLRGVEGGGEEEEEADREREGREGGRQAVGREGGVARAGDIFSIFVRRCCRPCHLAV